MKALRWAARGISAVLLLFLGLSFAGSLGREPLQPGDTEKLVLWATMMAAMIIAWRWELVGGALVIGNVLVQVARAGGAPLKDLWRSPFLIVGLLFFAAGIASAAANRRRLSP